MTSKTISQKELREQLNWRYAVKQYDRTRTVSEEDWNVLEDSVLLAPTSYGLQPFKLIVVTDPAIKERLREAAYGQPQITDSSHLAVFAYKKLLTPDDLAKFIDRVAEVRNVERESLADYEQVINGSAKRAIDGGFIEAWNSRQAYIALGFLLETAAMLGIDATPMEGFDAAKFNEILGLEEYSAVVVAAIGYRSNEDWLAPLPKVRARREDLVVRL